MHPLYALVRLLVRFWIWFFFRSVDVRHLERVPRHSPVLLCVNHPNNLIDSLLLGAVLPRQVHYLATATLFRNRLLAHLLPALGVIPIHRRQDDPDKTDQNVKIFEACFKAFEEGRVIAIIPKARPTPSRGCSGSRPVRRGSPLGPRPGTTAGWGWP